MHREYSLAFVQVVENALKHCSRAGHKRQWSLLAESPMAMTDLVTGILAESQVEQRIAIGLATHAVIQWGIDKLKPDGQPAWNGYEWRAYLILFHAYLQDLSFAELAEKLAISEQTVYQSRRTALAQLAEILHSELVAPQEKAVRRLYYLGSQYATYTATEQLILRLITVLALPLPMPTLLPLLRHAIGEPEEQLQRQVQRLLAIGALVNRVPADAIAVAPNALAVAPDFCHYLNTMRSSEVTAAHALVAAYYQASGAWWCAVDHYQRAGDHQSAAQICITQQRTFVNAGQTTQLLSHLQRFSRAQVDERGWAEIKLLAGDLAMQQQDVQQAVNEYQQALQATDGTLRAQAYYKRARAFLSLNLDETLLHYRMAIEALMPTHSDHPLLVRIHTDHAWFYIQEQPNLHKAEELLHQLEGIVSSTNQLGRSYLANAWAGLRHRQGQDEAALQQRLQAWVLANESADLEWRTVAGYNLGNDYVALQQYGQALTYYAHSRDLAQQIGDQAMQGLIEKSIGGCYFWLTDYTQAADHYQRAYQRLKTVGRLHWLAHLCYDLAELYAQHWVYPTLYEYLTEGRALCHQLRNHKLRAALEELAATVAWMEPLNERQLAALPLVKTAGAMTNRDYQTHTGCAQRQAVRDLNELCDLGILRREGQGRGVRYVADR